MLEVPHLVVLQHCTRQAARLGAILCLAGCQRRVDVLGDRARRGRCLGLQACHARGGGRRRLLCQLAAGNLGRHAAGALHRVAVDLLRQAVKADVMYAARGACKHSVCQPANTTEHMHPVHTTICAARLTSCSSSPSCTNDL